MALQAALGAPLAALGVLLAALGRLLAALGPLSERHAKINKKSMPKMTDLDSLLEGFWAPKIFQNVDHTHTGT